MDLAEILRGREGETFWSPVCGEVVFKGITEEGKLEFLGSEEYCLLLTSRGYPFEEAETLGGEPLVWPSKKNRDWEGTVCGRCREYTPIGGDCGVCPWVDRHITESSPACPHHRHTAEWILEKVKNTLREIEKEEGS